MNEPRVSIVIPVRNGMPFLPETIASATAAIESIGGAGEILVRENGSTDGTAEWLAALADPRVRVVIAEEPSSAAENWTSAVRLASAPWVKVLCADDAILPGGLARQLAAAEADPGLVLVSSRRRVVDERSKTVLRSHGLRGMRGRFDGSDAIRRIVRSGTNQLGEPSSVLLRRDVLESRLPFDATHPYVIDLEMYVRLLDLGPMVALASIDALFRVNTGSWSAEIGSRQLSDYTGWLDRVGADLPGVVDDRDVARGRLMAGLQFRARRVISAWVSRQGFRSSLDEGPEPVAE